MKSFTMFGSHVCPDTIAAMCILDKKGLSYTYKDITGTMIFLKEFLHLRDSREDFQAVKEGVIPRTSGRSRAPWQVWHSMAVIKDS